MKLATIRAYVWVYILLAMIVFAVFEFWVPTSADFEYTFQRPISHPDSLQSQRWSLYFVLTGLSIIFVAGPISLAFAMEDHRGLWTADHNGDTAIKFWRIWFHVGVTAMVGIFFLVTSVYLVVLRIRANAVNPGNYHNPANDPRWCCVHYTLITADTPSFPCYNTAGCTPGVSELQLDVNPIFQFQMWYTIGLFLVCVVDLLMTLMLILPVYEHLAWKNKK